MRFHGCAVAVVLLAGLAVAVWAEPPMVVSKTASAMPAKRIVESPFILHLRFAPGQVLEEWAIWRVRGFVAEEQSRSARWCDCWRRRSYWLRGGCLPC